MSTRTIPPSASDIRTPATASDIINPASVEAASGHDWTVAFERGGEVVQVSVSLLSRFEAMTRTDLGPEWQKLNAGNLVVAVRLDG